MINAETRYKIWLKMYQEQKQRYDQVVEYLKYTKHSKKRAKHERYIRIHTPLLTKTETHCKKLKAHLKEETKLEKEETK